MTWLLIALLSSAASAGVSSGTFRSDPMRVDAIDTSVQSLLSGRPTITGGPIFQGGVNLTGTSTFTAQVSLSSAAIFSGPVTMSANVYLSSSVYTVLGSTQVYPNGTTSQSTYQNCIANSTATITLSGNKRAIVRLSGTASDGAVSTVGLGFLIDGLYPLGLTSSKGVISESDGLAGGAVSMSFSWLTEVLSPGSHNFCLTAITNSGNLTIPSANSTAQFSVTESIGGN